MAVILLTLAVAVVLIILYFAVRTMMKHTKRPAPDTRLRSQPERGGAFSVPQNYFFGSNHSWVLLGEGGSVKIGIDDFAQRLLGHFDRIEIVTPGKTVSAGDPIARLFQGDRVAILRSPVSGKIQACNENVVAAPGLIGFEPYRSWFVSVEPSDLKQDLGSMTIGREAGRWLRAEIERLFTFFQKQQVIPANAAYDNSMLEAGVLERLDLKTWDSFDREFLGRTPDTGDSDQ